MISIFTTLGSSGPEGGWALWGAHPTASSRVFACICALRSRESLLFSRKRSKKAFPAGKPRPNGHLF